MPNIIIPQQFAGVEQLLFTKVAANMNLDTDQALIPTGAFSSIIITGVRCVNASTSLTTAAGGIYTAASKGGIAVVAAAQAYSALTGPTLGAELTLAAAGLDILATSALYLSLTTAQGAAATADFYVRGIILA